MPSGAGLNNVGQLGGIPILQVPANSAVVAAPLAAYGTNLGPPSYFQGANPQDVRPIVPTTGNDSGVQLLVASGYTKWGFQLVGPGVTGSGTAQVTVTLYGTMDPQLRRFAEQNAGNSYVLQGQSPDLAGSLTALAATSWFVLPGISAQSGSGTEANPITTNATGSSTLFSSIPVSAVRAVVTGTAATTGQMVTVIAFAIP
jgi:hypothetical protein